MIVTLKDINARLGEFANDSCNEGLMAEDEGASPGRIAEIKREFFFLCNARRLLAQVIETHGDCSIEIDDETGEMVNTDFGV